MRICSELWGKDVKRLEERFALNEKALEIHEKNLQLRLVALNELREEFSRKEAKFALGNDLTGLEKRIARIETVGAVWLSVITLALVIVGFVARFWK